MTAITRKSGTSLHESLVAAQGLGVGLPFSVGLPAAVPVAGPRVASESWTNASGGDWGTAANWSPATVPTSSVAATIGLAGTYTVTITAPEAAQSLSVTDAGAVVSDTSTLSIGTSLSLAAGVFQLGNGGEVSGGTISVASGADFQGYGGTLSGVKFQGVLDLSSRNSSLTVSSNTSFSGIGGSGVGTINFSGGDNSGSYLYALGDYTLNNAMLNIGSDGVNAAANFLYNEDTGSGNATLTLGSGLTITQTNYYAGILSSDATGDAIVNDGTINVNFYNSSPPGGTDGLFVIDASHFTNAGTINVSGGDTLDLTGNISAALIDSINVTSGGYISIAGTVTGGTLVTAGDVGSPYFFNQYQNPQNGYVYNQTGGELSGVAVHGDLNINGGPGGGGTTSFTLTGATTFAGQNGSGPGTISFGSGDYSDSYLYAQGDYTLNNAVLNIGSDGVNAAANFLYNEDTGSGNATLTLGSGLTITQTNYYAGILSSDATGDAIVNDGTINVNFYNSSPPGGTDGLFVIDASHFTNAGTINVSGGDTLDLTGNISAALIDSINVTSGGYTSIAGTVTGGTLVTAGDVGSPYFFNQYQNPQNGYVYNQTGGELSGVAVHGDLNINGGPGGGGTTSFTLTGATTFAGQNGSGPGTISFGSGDYSDSYLYAQGDYTLNNAVLNIGSDGNNGATNYLYNLDTGAGNATLTLGAALIINQTNFSAGILSSDASGDAIVNNGTINVNFYNSNPPNGYTTGLFTIDATHFTNDGTINVSGGDTLDLIGNISAGLIDSINVASNGYIGIAGTVTGGTLTTAGNVGGAYDSSSIGYFYNSTSGTLSGVTVHGTLNIPVGGDRNGVPVSLSFSLAGKTTFAGLGGSGFGTINFTGGDNSNCYLDAQGSYTLNNVILNIGSDDVNGATNYLVNQDGGSGNATLTLGSNLTINQSDVSAGIIGSAVAGDAVINSGTINADYSGGKFLINPLTFTNTGTLAVSNSDSLTLSTNFTNLSGTTLTGGTYIANANSTITLSSSSTIATDAANIILNGAGSNIQNLDSTLSKIAANGTLSLQNGRNFTVTANNSYLADYGRLNLAAGTLTATTFATSAAASVFGNGTITAAINNAGLIEANGGTLLLSSIVVNAGTLQIDAGATLEVGSTTAATQTTVFNGVGATLKMDAPTHYASVLENFAGGDVLDFGKSTLTSVSSSGTTLLAVSASGTTTLTLAAPLVNLHFSLGSDGAGGTNVTAYNLAQAAPHAPEPVVLGNVHVGATDSAFVTLTNSVPVNGYSEKLDAALGAATGSATATGTVSKLAAGASNASSLAIGLVTTGAGTLSGTATLTLASDGTGVDSFGTTTLASQTVNVSGAVYAYAQGTLGSAGTLTLANTHAGHATSGFVTLTNAAATGGYSEALDAAFSGASTGITTSGTLQGLAAGAQNTNALQIGFSPANTGTYTGTATLALTSDGTGIDGLGTTALAAQTLTVKGAAYAYAAGQLSAGGTVVLANTHVGHAVGARFSLTNSAAANGFSEALDASIKSNTAGISASGSISLLAAGASNATGLAVAATETAAGAYTGTATVNLVSDGTGIDGLGTTALAGQTVTVIGNAYAYAAAQLSSQTVNFGVVHVGAAASQDLTLTNTAAPGVYSEALDANWGTPSTGVSVTGSVSLLDAGANSQNLAIGLSTSSAGSFSGTAALALLSDGTGIDGLGTTALAGQTVTVSGIVDNYAVAAFQDASGPAISGAGTAYAINLGSVVQGSAASTFAVGVENAASGLADLLQGTVSATGTTGFVNSGFGSFAGLGAGQSETLQGVTLTTGTAGVFSETVLLSSAGTNASGYDGALATETLTITGTVVSAGTSNTYVLASGPNSIVGAAGGDLFQTASAGLNSLDSLTGGSGSNTLQMLGGGIFDLAAPKVFANIPTLFAYEGQAPLGSAADPRQTLIMPSGQTETLDVRTETPAQGNTNPETITIYDGADKDVFNLGANADDLYLGTGSDTVTLGGAANKVFAGGGTALVNGTSVASAASIVGSTTGSTVLNITNAGTLTLNAADTYLTVKLNAATHLTLGALGYITVNGSNGSDTIVAGGAHQTLVGGALDVLTGSTAGTDSFVGASAALNGDTLGNWTTGDVIDLTDMNDQTAQLGFAAGSSKDTLTVKDGTHNAAILFTGSPTAANFTVVGTDGSGGTLIGWQAS